TCLDDGLVLLMANEDVMNLLEYVPRFKEVDIYVEENVLVVERHMMERMVAPDTDDDASISGLEADFPKWINDDVVDEANEVELELENEEEFAIIFAELD
nr:transposase, MuDR, MULE transposase domain protein [Tanacetum cinerariifolium]